MPFVAARCPQCGGELQLDNDKEAGFCMHCGSKIIVQDAIKAVRIDNTHLIENWMKIGLSAAEAGNNEEAYNYFNKVIEVDPENWKALFYKGRAAAWQTTIARPRFNELFQGVKEAFGVLGKSENSQEQVIEAKNLFATTIYLVTEAFYNLVADNIADRDDLYLDDFDFMWETRKNVIDCISYQEIAMSLIDSLQDDISKSNTLEVKKVIAKYCCEVCTTRWYWSDYSKKTMQFFGYSIAEKQPYVEKYDAMVMEIRKIEPDFRKNKYSLIDRLEVPKNKKEMLGRIEQLEKLENEKGRK